jgi:hypothetical protein
MGKSACSESLVLSRVASEGSDLSGYVIGADLAGPQHQPPKERDGHVHENNVVVVQMECPRCQCIDRRCVNDLHCVAYPACSV